MQAEAARQDLTRALTQITRVVEARSTIPILNNVVLSVTGGVLTLRGTDLAIEVTCTVPAAGDDFTACVPAKQFADIVKRLPADQVTLDYSPAQYGGTLKVKAGRSRFNIPSIDSASFPTLAVDKYDCSFTADLAALVDRVGFAAAESDYANTDGIYLHIQDSYLAVAATDSKVLAAYQIDLPEGAASFAGAIIPPKLASVVPKGAAKLSWRADRVLIEQGDLTMCAKLIEGQYLNYRRAIPTDHERMVTVRKADLAAANDRIALVSMSVKINVAPGSLLLTGLSKDGQEASDEIAVEYHGEPTFVAFNCRYLADLLNATPGDEIALDLTDNTKFVRFRSTSDDRFVGVLGPYRMN